MAEPVASHLSVTGEARVARKREWRDYHAMNTKVCIVVGSLLLSILGGCGRGSPLATCIPGASVACACPTGQQGAQTCTSTGTHTACVCATPAVDASGLGGTGGTAVPSTPVGTGGVPLGTGGIPVGTGGIPGGADGTVTGGAGGSTPDGTCTGTPSTCGYGDAALTGGTPGKGGATGLGGIPGSDGGAAKGGSSGSGGIGLGGTGGGGGASCSNVTSNVTPCGGNVVGIWTVTPSCLKLSGNLDITVAGLDPNTCKNATITGALQVTGTWTANANGTYIDRTTTSGDAQIQLLQGCLQVTGTTITCERISGPLTSLGFDSVSCAPAAGGGCNCAATIRQTGGLGLLSGDPQTSGTYTTSGNVITADDTAQYSYCVSGGNKMTWTPQSANPTTTGTVVFQKGGSTGSGGKMGTGGNPSGGAGGATASGGAMGSGVAMGAGGSTGAPLGPCDIYAADGGPCVAAHSTVRALLGAYSGPLYQVRKADGSTKDIGVLAPGGFANAADQDGFCGTDTCTISVIYDQSGKGNHLTKAPPGGAKTTSDNEANAKALPITISGHSVYGEHNAIGVGYRNNQAVGTATGDDPETIYMITSGNYSNGGCCFEYGNAETNSRDNGEGAVEAVYFGTCTIWNKGAGNGPWVMADLENGLWAGNASAYESNQPVPTTWQYVTGLVKGDKAGANHWTIKVGNAQSGSLITPFDGPRPNARYDPMRKEGAIILGAAGDNSNAGQGNFFEGVMTAHYSSTAADDAVQANIVAAYGQ